MASITLDNAEVAKLLAKRNAKAVNGREVRLPHDISYAGQRVVRSYFPNACLTFVNRQITFSFESDDEAVLFRLKELSL